MKITWLLDDPTYGLTKDKVYDIDFRSEGNTIFVDVRDLKMNPMGTCVFVSMPAFLDACRFDGVTPKHRRVRKHTDWETTLYFTAAEVAELFGVHKNTINNWVASGRLKPNHRIGVGGHRRFDRDDVMALYQSMRDGFI